MEKRLGPGDVMKKKSSSGCLIIKKKGDAMRGIGSSSELYREKERSRIVRSDLGSSDESSSDEPSNPIRQKFDKFHNGSSLNPSDVVLRKSYFGRNGELERRRKRSRFNLYDFDGYDGFDEQEMRNDYIIEQSEMRREFRSGSSSKDIVYKRRHLYYKNSDDIPGGKDNRIESFNYDNKSDTEDDEPHLPISSLRDKFQQVSDEPIRLQGKSGVLKVMVNKKNKLALSHKSYGYQEAEARNALRSDDLVKRNILAQHSLHSDMKRLGIPLSYVKSDKTEPKQGNSLPTKSNNAADKETGGNDKSLKFELGSTSGQESGSVKRVKNEGKNPLPTENIKPIKGKEGKVERGCTTEKQLLRERIRTMFVNAGWTIEYRPRRNRDYLDAVYINPSGTAYWSIIKAFDAFQKQLDEKDTIKKSVKDSSQFIPLSEEILSKLTRRTRKKMEKEMNECAGSDQHEQKLSFHWKQNGKSLR